MCDGFAEEKEAEETGGEARREEGASRSSSTAAAENRYSLRQNLEMLRTNFVFVPLLGCSDPEPRRRRSSRRYDLGNSRDDQEAAEASGKFDVGPRLCRLVVSDVLVQLRPPTMTRKTVANSRYASCLERHRAYSLTFVGALAFCRSPVALGSLRPHRWHFDWRHPGMWHRCPRPLHRRRTAALPRSWRKGFCSGQMVQVLRSVMFTFAALDDHQQLCAFLSAAEAWFATSTTATGSTGA